MRERRRIARSIDEALAEIREHDPALARLLKTAIKTGQFFSIRPGASPKLSGTWGCHPTVPVLSGGGHARIDPRRR